MRVQVTDPYHAAADPGMPVAARALDPAEVQRHFGQLQFPASGDQGQLRLREIRVLRHKPGRVMTMTSPLRDPLLPGSAHMQASPGQEDSEQ